MKYPGARILVMSKAPEPGQVKTRLIPEIGAQAAAGLYRELLWNTLRMATAAGLCPVDLWCSPNVDHPYFAKCSLQFGVRLFEQVEGDLGDRMSHALQRSSAAARPVILIGADCPTLSAGDLEEAIDLLSGECEVVLGPAEDGGYYLIGMRGFYPCAFEQIPWSTSAVLAMTQARLDSREIEWRTLTRRRDLDEIEDYHSYLASGKSGK